VERSTPTGGLPRDPSQLPETKGMVKQYTSTHAGSVGQHFAAARGHFGHEGHFRARRFVPGLYDYDYGCSYG